VHSYICLLVVTLACAARWVAEACIFCFRWRHLCPFSSRSHAEPLSNKRIATLKGTRNNVIVCALCASSLFVDVWTARICNSARSGSAANKKHAQTIHDQESESVALARNEEDIDRLGDSVNRMKEISLALNRDTEDHLRLLDRAVRCIRFSACLSPFVFMGELILLLLFLWWGFAARWHVFCWWYV
jgi:hypothetical protein